MTGYYDCPEHLVKRLEGICGKLERELAEASDIAKKYEDRYFAVKTELDEVKEDFFEAKAQLTAHKTALEKCEKAFLVTWADLDHLNHWMPTPCRALYMEALSEIAKLKGTK